MSGCWPERPLIGPWFRAVAVFGLKCTMVVIGVEAPQNSASVSGRCFSWGTEDLVHSACPRFVWVLARAASAQALVSGNDRVWVQVHDGVTRVEAPQNSASAMGRCFSWGTVHLVRSTCPHFVWVLAGAAPDRALVSSSGCVWAQVHHGGNRGRGTPKLGISQRPLLQLGH